MRAILTSLLVMLAATAILGELSGQRWLVYVAKPAATTVVLLLALVGPSRVSSRYQRLIALGLALSLVGDVFLMLPGDRFVAGLAAFLGAHLCYIAAFAGSGGGLRGATAALGVGAFASLMLAVVWPGLGDLTIPVVAYVLVISTMAWQAIARWQHLGDGGAAFAAVGAIVFMVSDSALAVRRFIGDFTGGAALVLGTYWLAQYLIARSVSAGQRTEPAA